MISEYSKFKLKVQYDLIQYTQYCNSYVHILFCHPFISTNICLLLKTV